MIVILSQISPLKKKETINEITDLINFVLSLKIFSFIYLFLKRMKKNEREKEREITFRIQYQVFKIFFLFEIELYF